MINSLVLWGRAIKAQHLTILFVLLAACWRLHLASGYYGWEESDYGNLAMTKGVLDGGFLHFDMNHLPLYYAVSAAVMSVVGDATIASVGVSFASGIALVAVSVIIAWRTFGVAAAWLSGLFLVFQPELALYSASSLREPLYGLLVVLCLFYINERKVALASLIAGLAFLTRMDAALILTPVLVLAGTLNAKKRGGSYLAGMSAGLLPIASVVLLWSAYCNFEHGTFAFWGHSIAVNLETGGTENAGIDLLNGALVSTSLLGPVISSKFGLFVLLGWIVGLIRTPWATHCAQRNVALTSVLLMGFWLSLGFFGQHEPGHNLYWKWLFGVAAPFIVVAASGLLHLYSYAPMARIGRSFILGLGIMQAVYVMLVETNRQVGLSEEILGPQVELARWIEAETSDGNVMLLDNVPERWLSRRDHSRELYTWMDLPVCEDGGDSCSWSPDDFANWVQEVGVEYILWYGEEWTRAPHAAPWLRDAETWTTGNVTLTPLRSARLEMVDSWIFYEVTLR